MAAHWGVRRSVRGADVNEGRVDLSRLAEQRGGWLGVSKRDPAEDGPDVAEEPAREERER